MAGDFVDPAQLAGTRNVNDFGLRPPDDCLFECVRFDSDEIPPQEHGVYIVCGRLNAGPIEQALRVGLSLNEQYGTLDGVYKYCRLHIRDPLELGGAAYLSDDLRFCYIWCEASDLREVEEWAREFYQPVVGRIELNVGVGEDAF